MGASLVRGIFTVPALCLNELTRHTHSQKNRDRVTERVEYAI